MTSGCLQDLILVDEVRSEDGDIVDLALRPAMAVASAARLSCANVERGLGTLLVRLLSRPPIPRASIEAAVDERLSGQIRERLASSPDALGAVARLREAKRIRIVTTETEDAITFALDDCAVFEDGDGCAIAIEITREGRSAEVYRTWDGTADRVRRRQQRVMDAMSGRLRGFQARDGSDLLDPSTLGVPSTTGRPTELVARGLVAPAGFALRPYQRTAVDAWLRVKGRGILAMATGSGKTLVAVAAIKELVEATSARPTVVVTTPFIHLVDQWAGVFEQWGLRPIRCYEASTVWEASAVERLDAAAVHPEPLVLIATIQTASGAPFQNLLRRALRSDSILVADEVHHLGSPGSQSILDSRYRWRMGLSATPERHGDDVGTDRLLDFFGGLVTEFGIADGIHEGYLCPYLYRPVLVDFTPDELRRYRAIIGRIEQQAGRAAGTGRYLDLLLERAEALDTAEGKIEGLRAELARTRVDHTVVYCASRFQMGAAAQVLRDQGYIARPFTAEESRTERAALIDDFAAGTAPAITAIRALDEGVDIPTIRQAYLLASSGNPTQFIQRRGRILRTSPGKDQALLVDYVTIPAGDGPTEGKMVRQEMRRALEFGSTSLDPAGVVAALLPILDRFGCHDLLEEYGWE